MNRMEHTSHDNGISLPPKSSINSLDNKGLVRIQTIMQHIDCSASTWWRWVKKGIAPQPIKVEGGGTFWRVEDIVYFICHGKAPVVQPEPEEGER